ncbi:hypothetical protein FRB99_006375 [Tulasnella sp. 403]|nr:hypothetical protein FRB99_006375 [Tulasnella sp. 403]
MSTKTHTAIALVEPRKLGEIQVPTRSPDPDEVLLKVNYATYTAADGHAVDDDFYVSGYPQAIGLVAVGKVVEVGSNVEEFKEGDEVGAFTQPGADRATQEYVVAPSNRVTRVPRGVSPEAVAAIVDNFVCGWWTITSSLQLPLPHTFPARELIPNEILSSPILVWGGGTGAATYTLQLLRLAGFTNIITTASPRSAPAAFNFGATHVLDYNDPDVVEKIKKLAGSPIKHALDPVGTRASLANISQIVTEPGSRVAVLVPVKAGDLTDIHEGGAKLFGALPQELNPFGPGVDAISTYTFQWESDEKLKPVLLNKILPSLLESGRIKPQEIHIVKDGSLLERVQKAAELLKSNQVKGAKIIIDFNA